MCTAMELAGQDAEVHERSDHRYTRGSKIKGEKACDAIYLNGLTPVDCNTRIRALENQLSDSGRRRAGFDWHLEPRTERGSDIIWWPLCLYGSGLAILTQSIFEFIRCEILCLIWLSPA
jgi:hypothetical protein